VWESDREVYRPEIARTTFLKAKVLFRKNDVKDATEAFKEAANLRRKTKYAAAKDDRDLVEDDFDDLVTFWSR
jgi:hypothetical protein